MHHSLFLICQFVCTYTHNSKTTGRLRMYHISNDCSTVGVVYFLDESCVWDTISKLRLQTDIRVSFWYGRSTYWTTFLLLEMSIFWIRVVCEIRLASYGSKYTSQSLFDMPFVCTSTHKLKSTGFTWAFRISNNCSTMGERKFGVFLIWQHCHWQ